MKKLKAVVIGAGGRGEGYAKVMKAQSDKFEVVAVAEPKRHKRNHLKEMWNLPDEMCFETWEPLLELGKIADFAIIATMDREHLGPSMKAISLGYDLLLEKPIAPTAEECYEIAKAAEDKGVKTIVCHVLRYAPLFMNVKEILDSGKIGDIVSIAHEECVGNVHQSHSFVRGNWGNKERSSFMLLQKCCHDLDMLQWLIGKKCKKVQSFGALTYFTEKNAPEGAPERCIEGCPKGDTCPYNAINLYLKSTDGDWFRPLATHSVDRDNYVPTDEDVEKALWSNQYGKCVYKCDNNVVDHQTVNMLFEDDVTVAFTMCAFNKGGRYLHVMGTKGELHAKMDDSTEIKIYDFETKETTITDGEGKDGVLGGHGGGDESMFDFLYDYFARDIKSPSITEAMISWKNHAIVFAAEEARLSGTIVDVDEYIKKFN